MKRLPLTYLIGSLFLAPALTHSATIIDDSDPGFNVVSGISNSEMVGFDGTSISSVIVQQTGGVMVATWTFAGLNPSLTYDVAATWSHAISGWPPNNYTTADYIITGSTVVNLAVPQNVLPTADYVENDGAGDHNFQSLGQVQPKVDGTIVLQIEDNNDDGIRFVLADAALVNAVPEPSSSILLGTGTLILALRRKRL